MRQAVTGTTKGERTAQRIMDEAERLFATRGYSATTLREIAEGAGLREPGLYNHFASKEALYKAVLERVLSPLAGVIDQQLENMNVEGSEGPRELPSLVLDLMAAHPHMPALFQRALISPEDDIGHSLMLDWMESLMKKSLIAVGQMDSHSRISEDAALMVIAMFNLGAGYFTAAPMLRRLSGRDARTASILDKQKWLMKRVSGHLLADMQSSSK